MLTIDNGQWTIDNLQFAIDNGLLTMDNGQWTIPSGLSVRMELSIISNSNLNCKL